MRYWRQGDFRRNSPRERLLLTGESGEAETPAPPPPPPWSPLEIPGLVAFWDASSLALSDGAAVTSWTDSKSGLVLTGTATFKSYTEKKSLLFNGTTDGFALVGGLPASAFPGSNPAQPFTVGVRCRFGTVGSLTRMLVDSNPGSGNRPCLFVLGGTPTQFSVGEAPRLNTPVGTRADNVWYTLTAAWNAGLGTLRIYTTTSTEYTGATTSTEYTGATTVAGWNTGVFQVGRTANGGYMVGDISAVWVASGVASPATIAAWEQWAA